MLSRFEDRLVPTTNASLLFSTSFMRVSFFFSTSLHNDDDSDTIRSSYGSSMFSAGCGEGVNVALSLRSEGREAASSSVEDKLSWKSLTNPV